MGPERRARGAAFRLRDSWAPALRTAASFLAQSGTIEDSPAWNGVVLDVSPVVTQHVNGAPAARGGDTTGGRDRRHGAMGLTNTLTMTGTTHPDCRGVSRTRQFVIDPRRACSFGGPFSSRGSVVQRAAHAHLHARHRRA